MFCFFSDVRKLARDFIGFDVQKMVENCIELGHIANNVVPNRQRWSMEKLVDQFVSIYFTITYTPFLTHHFIFYHNIMPIVLYLLLAQ